MNIVLVDVVPVVAKLAGDLPSRRHLEPRCALHRKENSLARSLPLNGTNASRFAPKMTILDLNWGPFLRTPETPIADRSLQVASRIAGSIKKMKIVFNLLELGAFFLVLHVIFRFYVPFGAACKIICSSGHR